VYYYFSKLIISRIKGELIFGFEEHLGHKIYSSIDCGEMKKDGILLFAEEIGLIFLLAGYVLNTRRFGITLCNE